MSFSSLYLSAAAPFGGRLFTIGRHPTGRQDAASGYVERRTPARPRDLLAREAEVTMMFSRVSDRSREDSQARRVVAFCAAGRRLADACHHGRVSYDRGFRGAVVPLECSDRGNRTYASTGLAWNHNQCRLPPSRDDRDPVSTGRGGGSHVPRCERSARGKARRGYRPRPL
jgi:hypothetical protein